MLETKDDFFNILDNIINFFGKYSSTFHLVEKDTTKDPNRQALDDGLASDPDSATGCRSDRDPEPYHCLLGGGGV